MEQTEKVFETKQQALDFMHFLQVQQCVLVNHEKGWVVVYHKQFTTVEGELDGEVVLTS